MRTLSQTVNYTQQTLIQVEDLDSAAETKLDSVVSETQKLEQTVQELLDQVEFIKNSDIRGKSEHRQGGGLLLAFITCQTSNRDKVPFS